MFNELLRALIKIAVASLVLGAIMHHFGITPDSLLKAAGMSQERAIELARGAVDWALPKLILGALVVVPVWIVVCLFRPPRPRIDLTHRP